MSGNRDSSGIPLFDLSLVHEPIFSELTSAVEQVAKSNRFINGKSVSDFEAAFERYHGSGYAVGLSSGTDALLVALMAMGVGPGDEVITTPFTFVSTAEVILRVGAKPVFVDIDEHTFCIDAKHIASKITSRTKAIIPVHLFGRACSMEEIHAVSEQAGLVVIEDCAQAMGARARSNLVGTLGDFGAFSFFPTKNLGGWGDGGMLLCSTREKALRVKSTRDHGAIKKGRYESMGGNFRLDSVQAAVLLRKLDYVDEWRQKRQRAARLYNRLFAEAGFRGHASDPLIPPSEDPQGEHSFGLYVIRASDRDELADYLAQSSIGCGKYYDMPLHLQGSFSHLGYERGDFPVAEGAARQVLAIPCYAGITEEAQETVVQAITGFYNS